LHAGKRLQGVEVGGDVGERELGGQVADAGAGLLKERVHALGRGDVTGRGQFVGGGLAEVAGLPVTFYSAVALSLLACGYLAVALCGVALPHLAEAADALEPALTLSAAPASGPVSNSESASATDS
jgi:hypothetical protein